MKLGINCTHPDDLEAAERILTQFGEATGCTVVADGHATAVVGNIVADEATVRSVRDAVTAINAQIINGRTFRVFMPGR